MYYNLGSNRWMILNGGCIEWIQLDLSELIVKSLNKYIS